MGKKYPRIGILGGGQLARMMATEAQENDFDVKVLGQKSKEPASFVTKDYYWGPLTSSKFLKSFFKKVDVITFESEFIDLDLIEELAKKMKVTIRPSAKIMRQLQDRKSQKAILEKHSLPVTPNVDNPKLATYMVAKARRNGYDGYGTYVLKNKKQVSNFFKEIKKNKQNKNDYIYESLIKFKRELALTAVRSKNKDIIFYPLAEWKAKDSKCFWVKGPVEHKLIQPLKKKIQSFLHKTNYVGAITFELFDLGSKLLINEVAPRVHNSAHHTLDSTPLSQFKAHLYAVSGAPLKNKYSSADKAFAMVNLIGSSKKRPQLAPTPESHLYWYDKAENRPGRKMGHVNSLGETPASALKKALKDSRRVKL